MMTAKKVMILGDIGVGKTSITNRFVFDRFDTNYKATIGVDIYTHDCVYDWEGREEAVRLVLWDTDGDFGLSIFSTIYLKGAAGAVVVGDVSRPSSVTKMADLVAQFIETMPGRPCIAVLNKTDLLAQGEEVPEVAFDASPDAVLTTSAKDGSGITKAFTELAKAIRRRQI